MVEVKICWRSLKVNYFDLSSVLPVAVRVLRLHLVGFCRLLTPRIRWRLRAQDLLPLHRRTNIEATVGEVNVREIVR